MNDDTGDTGDTGGPGTDAATTASSMPTTGATSGGPTTTTTGEPLTSEPGTSTGTTADSDDPLTTTTSSSSEGSSSSGDGSTGDPPPCCAAPDEPSAAVDAMTPLGPLLNLGWASFGVSSGECGGGWFLHLYPDASQVGTEGSDELLISAQEDAFTMMWPDGFIGTGPVTLTARIGDESVGVEAEITVVEVDTDGIGELSCFEPPVTTDAHVLFTIAVELDGWSVQGMARAEYCPTLTFACP
jgi:hypothetical protein